MTLYFMEECTRCGHVRMLHKFPAHEYKIPKNSSWGRESNDPGCRVNHTKNVGSVKERAEYVMHRDSKLDAPCPCEDFVNES